LPKAWPELTVVAEAENGEQALALADECRPDVAFLDIRMPLVSGIEVARALAGRCHVVFVTAYDEYAVAAFDEGAVDYLLKPVTGERIAKVTQRVKARLATPPLDLAALLTRLAEREDASVPLKWIRASLGNVMQMIAVVDVVYFQAEDKYTKVVTRDSEALIKKPIKDLYDELDQEAFWQIHRATIVNLNAIARRRTRLARPARDHAEVATRKAHRLAARSRIASRRCSGAGDWRGAPRSGGSTVIASRRSRPTRGRVHRAARAMRPRRRSVWRGPAQWGIETRASTAPPCPGGYRRTCKIRSF
jgi:DNA-binding LytR/AlgR family response regulator